jgi:hypothetical protein
MKQYARPHATLLAQHAILQESATVIKDGAVLIAMKQFASQVVSTARAK